MTARRDSPDDPLVSVSASGTLRTFIASADISVALVARDGRIVSVNRAWQEFASANGADPDEVGPGANYFDVCRRADPVGVEIGQRLERLAAGEQRAFVHEYPCHSPSRDRWMSMQAGRVSSPDFEGFVVTHVDITDSVGDRVRHAREHVLLARILSDMPRAVFWKDARLRYEGANRAFNELAGLDPECDVAGLADDDLPLTGTLVEALASAQRRVLETGVAVENAEFALTQNRRRRLMEASVSPLRDSDGAIVGLVGILRDITDKAAKAREESDLRRYQTLAHVAAAIAHEVNTPAQYIRGNLDFLEEAFTGLKTRLEACLAQGDDAMPGDLRWIEDIPAALEDAAHGVEQMSRSITSLLQFAGRPGDQGRAVDLNLGLRGLVPVLRQKWPHLSSVMVDLDERLPTLNSDGARIIRAVYALLDNAAEATAGMEDARILITTRRVSEGIEILVSDTGPGIAPEFREKIFQPFFSTREFEGKRGMGLANAHDVIVERHGGGLTVQSSDRDGTTFRVLIPLADEQRAFPPAGRRRQSEEPARQQSHE